MYNVTYVLAKAIQTDHLRDAQNNRLARLIETRRKESRKTYRKQERNK